MTRKHFSHNWIFVVGMYQSMVIVPHKEPLIWSFGVSIASQAAVQTIEFRGTMTVIWYHSDEGHRLHAEIEGRITDY